MKKKFLLALFVALFTVIAAVSVSAETYSGDCGADDGDNVKWTLDTNTGVLKLTGSGEMCIYSSDGYIGFAPWYDYRDFITTVSVQNGITEIGTCAFYDCTSLTSITIPSSVTSIGDEAFIYCTSLTSITIPSSVTYIGFCTFKDCTNLTSITIPSSVNYIGFSAFENTGIYNNSANWENGALYIDNWLIEVNSEIRGKYAVKNSCVGIANGVFSGCESLTSITIPSSVTSIGYSTFAYCTSLTSINIPSSVTSIESGVFSDCTSLTSITIPSSVTSIGGSAFFNCTSLTSITIPNSVTSIDYWAFDGCTSLTSITIPNSVTSIGYSAFSGCTSLTSITIPSSVTSIGDEAFSGCTSLTSINIPSSVTSIESGVFSDCTSLASINIPSSVTSITSSAFGNTGIYNNSANWENGALYIDNWLIEVNSEIRGKYAVKNSCVGIANDVFYDCESLTSITIPSSVTSIGSSAFKNTGIYNNSANWENGALYIDNWLIKVNSKTGDKYAVKNSCVGIANSAFSDCESLTSITIPSSVTSIGDDVFHGCKSLTSITIPSSVTSIGDGAFEGCTSLSDVYFGGSETIWNSINVGMYNEPLQNANIHFALLSAKENQVLFTMNERFVDVGGKLVTNDVAPIIYNDRTMLPARFVAENLGATVGWDAAERKVTITGKHLKTGEAVEIHMFIEIKTAYINGEAVKMDTVPFIRNNRTYTPVRFIAEALGATVEWSAKTAQAIIAK